MIKQAKEKLFRYLFPEKAQKLIELMQSCGQGIIDKTFLEEHIDRLKKQNTQLKRKSTLQYKKVTEYKEIAEEAVRDLEDYKKEHEYLHKRYEKYGKKAERYAKIEEFCLNGDIQALFFYLKGQAKMKPYKTKQELIKLGVVDEKYEHIPAMVGEWKKGSEVLDE